MTLTNLQMGVNSRTQLLSSFVHKISFNPSQGVVILPIFSQYSRHFLIISSNKILNHNTTFLKKMY